MTPPIDHDAILRAEEAEGYCVVPEVLTPQQTDAAREALHAIETVHAGESIRTTGTVITRHDVFRGLVAHPLLLDLRRRVLGEDMVCSSCTGITLLPGHQGMGWHVDYPYWSIRSPYPASPIAAYALWMLDDFTADNGATGVIPGSHRHGHPPPAQGEDWPAGAQIATGPKGSLLLFTGPLWHSARPNRSMASRSAIMIAFVRAFCIPHTRLRDQIAMLRNPTDDEWRILGAEQFLSRQERFS